MKTELVTNLKRKATEIIASLGITKNPVLITEHGKPAAYLVDTHTFEYLFEKMAILEGIARGEKAIQEKRTLTHEQVKKRMERWLK